jgi:hypothetical protein
MAILKIGRGGGTKRKASKCEGEDWSCVGDGCIEVQDIPTLTSLTWDNYFMENTLRSASKV